MLNGEWGIEFFTCLGAYVAALAVACWLGGDRERNPNRRSDCYAKNAKRRVRGTDCLWNVFERRMHLGG